MLLAFSVFAPRRISDGLTILCSLGEDTWRALDLPWHSPCMSMSACLIIETAESKVQLRLEFSQGLESSATRKLCTCTCQDSTAKSACQPGMTCRRRRTLDPPPCSHDCHIEKQPLAFGRASACSILDMRFNLSLRLPAPPLWEIPPSLMHKGLSEVSLSKDAYLHSGVSPRA